MRIGYKLATEGFAPKELIKQAVLAEHDELPVIAVAASGPESAKIAAELGDGLFAVEPDADLAAPLRALAPAAG